MSTADWTNKHRDASPEARRALHIYLWHTLAEVGKQIGASPADIVAMAGDLHVAGVELTSTDIDWSAIDRELSTHLAHRLTLPQTLTILLQWIASVWFCDWVVVQTD